MNTNREDIETRNDYISDNPHNNARMTEDALMIFTESIMDVFEINKNRFSKILLMIFLAAIQGLKYQSMSLEKNLGRKYNGTNQLDEARKSIIEHMEKTDEERKMQ